MIKLILTLFVVCCGLSSWAQPKDLYVFRNEKRDHHKQAKADRQAHREAALHLYYDLNVWTRTMTHEAKVNLHLKKPMDTEIAICDMKGNTLEQIHVGKLKKGKHEFDYEPSVTLHRPLLCVFRVDGRLESMKVMKFNSF